DMMARHPNDEVAFIQFDVERFKMINENYGAEAGDELLAFIKDSLSLICNEDQPFCRLTADVFMLVTAYSSDEELLDFIHRLESMLTGFKGMEYRLIFGVAIAEDRTLHTRRHGDNATIARQSIKGNALNNIGFFNGRMRTELKKKQTIEDDMKSALLGNQFVMFLQPKFSISTGRIIGAEALARWIHPEKGMISPAEFVPVFEQNGFILKLDQFIWESACKKIRDWIDRGIQPVPISVNISREYVRTFDVVGWLTKLIQKYDIPIKYLELEITESVDAEGVVDVVKNMKSAGFTMLMDDFGSGYSSLNMLKTTQFHVLKIDRAFLSEFMESSRGRKIISHTISMSQDIGLDIIAEGVETQEQAQFLSHCGCDAAQGFYYSKPVTQEEFDRKLLAVNT
ncbi:MAG: putative bifunctional diguanylate cyclase/phosphodiesterase, partial [Oscillospiraceae bacterium]